MAKKISRQYFSFINGCFAWGEPIILAYIIVILINMFVFRQFGVHQKSMLNTLVENDRILTTTMFYEPKQKDIVVIHQKGSQNNIVKRIIAVGRQVVDIKDGHVVVDGIVLDEPYAGNVLDKDDAFFDLYANTNYTLPAEMDFPCTVPEGKVFVLGDNRIKSKDSRYNEIGFVDNRDIIGKVVFRIFPFNKIGLIN